jgi:hypothetical protein
MLQPPIAIGYGRHLNGADSMTLIACLHPGQCRTLFADTLITSPKLPVDDLIFPTRKYIPLQQLRELQFKPVALYRKIIEISPNLVALWSGDIEEARRFADRAAVYFDGKIVEEDGLEKFLSDNYSLHVPNFHAIIVPADDPSWLYKLGDVDQAFSRFAGHYFVAGRGKQLFKDMVDQAVPSKDSHPDMDGLRIANEFMMQEVVTGGPTRAAFGAAFEYGIVALPVLSASTTCCIALQRQGSIQTAIEIDHYPHFTRQWYEGDHLCIASLSTPEAHQQGIEFRVVAIPSLQGQWLTSLGAREKISRGVQTTCV